MAALRELLAQFIVEVDPSNALARGNAAVDTLKAKFVQTDAAAKKMSGGVSTALARVDQAAKRSAGAGGGGALSRALTGGLGGIPALSTLFPAAGGGGRGGGIGGMLRGSAGLSAGPGGVGFFARIASSAGAASLAIGGAVAGVMALATAGRQLVGVVDQLGGIGEEAAKLGVANDEFQRLQVLAAQNATSVQSLGTAFRTLANAAVQPTKESTKAFAALGVEVKQQDGTFKSRQELFFETAGALADIEDTTRRAAMAQDLYGRSALELAPLLANGRAGIEEQREALLQIPVAADSAIEAADALSDRWASIGQQMLGTFAPVLEDSVIPALEELTDWFVGATKALGKFLDDSRLLKYGGLIVKSLIMPFRLVGRIFERTFNLIGVKGEDAFAKLGDAIGRVSLAFTTLMTLPMLLADDYQTYLAGGDSVIGRAIAGMSQAFDAAFDFLKNKAFTVLGDIVARAGTAADEIARALVPGYDLMQGGAAAATPFGPGGFGAAGFGIPLPPQAGAAGAVNNVSVGDTSVTINGVNTSDARAVAGAVGQVLQRDRNAIVAGVP